MIFRLWADTEKTSFFSSSPRKFGLFSLNFTEKKPKTKDLLRIFTELLTKGNKNYGETSQISFLSRNLPSAAYLSRQATPAHIFIYANQTNLDTYSGKPFFPVYLFFTNFPADDRIYLTGIGGVSL